MQLLSAAAVVASPPASYAASMSAVWVLLLLGLSVGKAEAFRKVYIGTGLFTPNQVASLLCIILTPPYSPHPLHPLSWFSDTNYLSSFYSSTFSLVTVSGASSFYNLMVINFVCHFNLIPPSFFLALFDPFTSRSYLFALVQKFPNLLTSSSSSRLPGWSSPLV